MEKPITDVRRRILDATLELIGELGVNGLSNRAVAKKAGVALGTLTYHFAAQQELLAESLNLFVDDEVSRLRGIVVHLADSTSHSPALLMQLVQTAIEEKATSGQQIAQLELYLQASRDTNLRESAAARCYKAYDEVSVAALTALGIANPEQVAPLVGALIDGYELRRLAVNDLPISLSESLVLLFSGLSPAINSIAEPSGETGNG